MAAKKKRKRSGQAVGGPYGRAPTPGEIELAKHTNLCTLTTRCWRYLCYVAGTCGPTYFVYKAASSVPESSWNKFATISVENHGLLGVSLVVNIIMVVTIRMQRGTHKDAIERLALAPKQLQQAIHPQRTSSRLTARGDSPASDN